MHVHDDHRHGDMRDISRGSMHRNRRLDPWSGSPFREIAGGSADELPDCVESLSKVGGIAGEVGWGEPHFCRDNQYPRPTARVCLGGFQKS